MTGGAIRVLHVDAEAGRLERTADLLERAGDGFEVETETDPGEALEWLHEGSVDCLVSGYRLPGTDGLEFRERVRTDHPELPFVLYAGDLPGGIAGELASAGSTDYVRRVNSDAEEAKLLAARITATLERSRATTDGEGCGCELVRTGAGLEVLFEKAPDAIVVHDADGKVLAANERHAENLGYTREQLRSTTVADYEVGHGLETLHELWAEMDADERVKLEGRHRRKDGSTYPVEVWVNKVRIDGEDRFLALSRDISDRKEMEAQLRRREERFRRLFERHSAPMLLIDPETGAIQNANEAAAEFYGHSVEDLTDMGIQEINRLSAAEVARERKRAEREDRNHFVFDHELATGEVRTVEVHSSPIELDGGELLFSVIHDITERLEYERELERYKELIENVPVGIYRNTPGESGRFIEVNPAMVEMFDADSQGQLCEHAVSDLYVEPGQRREFSQRLEEERLVTEEQLRLKTLTGETFWGSITAIAMDYGDGETYFDGVIQDVTARKEYEKRLEDQRDDLELLNQIVRHDIRNDLQLVLAYAEALEAHVDEDGREYVETVLTSARNAVDLTKTARDVAEVMLREETGRERLSLRRHLRGQLEEVREAYPDAEFTVEGTIPAVGVLADDMLDSVLDNVLVNAVEHNDADVPRVTVSVTEREGDVEIRIADNGSGVPDDRKEGIFGKGEKGLESQGTGIGLYLVNELVGSYGGEVWVEDGESGGAVFVIRLPLADAD